MTERRLIVNADDLGLSHGVNQGILTAHQHGIVSSATLLANGPAFDDAVTRIRQTPELGVGVHLNILRGPPLLETAQLPEITRDGRFHLTWATLFQTCRHPVLAAVEREYRAQIERVLDHGVRITHLDGEKHHHQFPPLFDLTVRLLEAYTIPAVRCAPERTTPRYGLKKMAGVATLNLLIRRNRHHLRRTGIAHVRWQTGIAATGHLDRTALAALLAALEPGDSELCCHPGHVDDQHQRESAGFGRFYIDASRDAEIAALTDPAIGRSLEEAGIRRITYAQLAGKG